jgi:hypothetical protein
MMMGLKNESTQSMIDELMDRGVYFLEEDDNFICHEINEIIQMHRCNDERWKEKALDFLHKISGKIRLS